MKTVEINRRLCQAFPAKLAADVAAVISIMPEAEHEPTDTSVGPVCVMGELLQIPYRIYHPEPEDSAMALLTQAQRDIVACLYTRHHDGHVRQRHLSKMIHLPTEWAPPFVLQLLGEYVGEIHLDIEANISRLEQPSYVAFACDNPKFIELTCQRIVSYWDCYFRRRNVKLQDHTAFHALEKLRISWEAAHNGVAPEDRPRMGARG
jgi:hypothetical protein